MHTMNASRLFCGLDIHRNGFSCASIVDELGKTIKERKLSNESISQFLASCNPSKIAMEAPIAVTFIFRELIRNGYEIVFSHAAKTRLIAESRIKTNRVHLHALAELLRLDALPPSYMLDEDVSKLREMVRQESFSRKGKNQAQEKDKRLPIAYEGIKMIFLNLESYSQSLV